MRSKIVILLAALICAPAFAFAHAAKIGPHGGRQTDAGPFHVEVVSKDAKLEIYLYSHALKPVDTVGFKGVAIFKAADGKPMRIMLEPAGDNRLSGVAPSPLPAQIEGAVQITSQTGGSAQGKFSAHEDDASQGEHDHEH